MERNSPSEEGEQNVRDGHLPVQRDSWSEEIDPFRSNDESDRWPESGNNFQQESSITLEEGSHPLDRDHLERNNLFEDDQLEKHNKRDRQSSVGNGDTLGCEKEREFVRRHQHGKPGYERERVMDRVYDLHCEGDNLSIDKAYPARAGYERNHEPMKGYERLSVERAHTVKDFEKQITELKKENFNLKLRIYFLEEQVQRHCDNSSEELHRMNIELKVEVESLKHEYQEKQNLLVRASKAMESLSGERNFFIQQLKDDHLKQLQDLEEASHRKIQQLEEELKQEKAELEKICLLLDQERMQRFNVEERLLAVKEQYSKSMGILEERDWIIQCLNETLRSKDALIAQLEKQINTIMPSDSSNENAAKIICLLQESDLGRPHSPGLTCRDCLATKSTEEKEESVNEWQNKVKEMDNVIHDLQQKLEDNRAGIAIEEKNSLKRDKAIQGLTLALKKKTKENEKLLKEIDNLNASLAEARESGLHDQSQNLRKNSNPDYKKLILTIQAQQDLCSRLHEYERESGSLQKELDAIVMLRKWLEKDIKSNQELREILEAQIMERCRESDTMSFLGDQTSYLSICLDHLGENNNHVDGNVEAVNRPHMKSVETQTIPKMSSLSEEHFNSLQVSKLELSAIEKDAKEESSAAFASNPKHEFIECSQSMASSSTQTALKCYVDKGILVNLSAFGKETSEDVKNGAKETLSDSGSHQFTSDIRKSSCEIQNDKQQKCFSNNLTKSRIPVLLKTSLSKRLKTEACLTSRKNKHSCIERELQEENHRLLQQLECAKLEIGAFKSNKETPKGTPQGWDDSEKSGNESSRQILQGDLQSERLSGVSEQLICAEIEVKKLLPVEDAGQRIKFPSDLEKPEKEKRGSLQNKELQLGTDKLSGDIKSAHLENENHPSSELVPKSTNTKSVSDNENIAERDWSAQPLHKELQLENLKLVEQLKYAQMDIEKLQSREVNIESKNVLSDADIAYTIEGDMVVRSLIKELQLENQRLVEQLKFAQVEIEKLREEKVSEDIDSSFRLDNIDTEDRDSEHSFLDKTITNAISLSEIHNGNPDFDVQVNSHNFTCQNIAGLCCHHERFCMDCANQETLIFQASSFKKVSTIQKACKLLTVSSHRPFEDTSLSKYDLLVQSQARELSHQRQKIKESHNLSVVCSKNFINVLKASEDFLSTSSLDSNVALGFREQLAQTVEWLKELEYKLSDAYYGEDDANSDHSADSLLFTPSRLVPGHKMWADKHGCHVLGLVEDYNALRKQILEAKTVLEETEAFIDHGAQTAVLNMTEHFGNIFFEKLNRTKQSLEEASCLLKLLWRVSLPLQTHSTYSMRQVEETNLEMTRLRKRVLEQEKLLSGMVKRVYSENQVKEDIEKLILNQLAMTHEILKRAKGNLEVQVVDQH